MFAVIKTGGKQYKVAKDDILRVERMTGEPGTKVELGPVLMLGGEKSVTLGTPYIEGASVSAEIVEQMRDKKILVFKKKRRKNHRRLNGHRQHLTVLRVTGVNAEAKTAAKPKAAAKGAEETKATEEAKAPEKAASESAAKKSAPKKAAPKKAKAEKAATEKAEAKKAAPKKAAPKKAAPKKPAAGKDKAD